MLQIVVIDLETQDDPNLIFETLNARGTPLEESDLVKNYVMSGEQGLELWGNLDDSWWREDVRQGRIRRPRLDMLLNHWLAMRTSSEVASANVFNAFRTYSRSQEIGVVMTEVKDALMSYREYDTTRGNNISAGLFYHRMSVMEVGVVTSVLLLLLVRRTGASPESPRCLGEFLSPQDDMPPVHHGVQQVGPRVAQSIA